MGRHLPFLLQPPTLPHPPPGSHHFSPRLPGPSFIPHASQTVRPWSSRLASRTYSRLVRDGTNVRVSLFPTLSVSACASGTCRPPLWPRSRESAAVGGAGGAAASPRWRICFLGTHTQKCGLCLKGGSASHVLRTPHPEPHGGCISTAPPRGQQAPLGHSPARTHRVPRLSQGLSQGPGRQAVTSHPWAGTRPRLCVCSGRDAPSRP